MAKQRGKNWSGPVSDVCDTLKPFMPFRWGYNRNFGDVADGDTLLLHKVLIQAVISSLSDNLRDLADQKVVLDERMAKLEQRFAMQYASMETAVAGLKDTGDYLTQMLKSKD